MQSGTRLTSLMITPGVGFLRKEVGTKIIMFHSGHMLDLLWVMGDVIIHHNNDPLLGHPMLAQYLIGMTDISLG